jgi:anti-sigma regulatory factor (Ser/Thr protein kinase)
MATRWRFPAAPEAVGEARRATRELAQRYGLDDVLIASIMWCVSEAVTNAVVHAYRDYPDAGDIELEARKSDGYLCIYVRDSGLGMRPRPDTPGAGIGLSLITQLAAEVAIRSSGGDGAGTELAMRFELDR